MSLYYANDNGNPEDEEQLWTEQQPDSTTPSNIAPKRSAVTTPADLGNADTDTLNEIDDIFFKGLQDRR